MHISEGILNTPTLVAGWAISAPLFAYTLYKIPQKEIPKVALLSALFFVGSFIHIPFGPTSFHLILSGLIGAIGGVYAILSITIALVFQALLFGFGGLGVLGINILVLSIPTIIIWYFLKPRITTLKTYELFLGGALPALFSLILLSAILLSNHIKLEYGVMAIFLYNLPLLGIEGLICVFSVKFILQYMPRAL
ncbi:cobalt transporter CbiM [Helicobacter cholecystus]|uniref:Cobalt transporter CbiM n=1 Tax=Helicobacter cholecystus TaxID=45498 RepID=A0A3D8IXK1_9HELI|nr:cobalt transporter CbiM [Helicobacter cholecystus]RDU69988.1 cobalt transporter CbiM [Helicobacter cholecystus]VEJ24842.1 cobalt transport protein CbiM [Helicobacter cholecystus]